MLQYEIADVPLSQIRRRITQRQVIITACRTGARGFHSLYSLRTTCNPCWCQSSFSLSTWHCANSFDHLPFIDQIIPRTSAAPRCDFYLPLMSAPLIFQTRIESIPNKTPYITPDPTLVQQWKAWLSQQRGRLKIGIVWQGNPDHLADLATFPALPCSKGISTRRHYLYPTPGRSWARATYRRDSTEHC